MKFLLDVNLAPRWCGDFERHGHAAVHWKDVGPLTAPDAEIMRHARENGYVLFTHDLDHATALALTHASGPSVIQVRAMQPLPEAVGPQVFSAIERYKTAIVKGALLTVDPGRSRVRLLPFPHAR